MFPPKCSEKMISKTLLRTLLFSFLTISCSAQLHLLKYINSGTSPSPNVPPQFSSSMPNNQSNVRNRFSNADSICVSGMWALYNTTFFGEGAEDSTTVISVRGTDITTCTQAGQVPVLKNVQSVVYLGSARFEDNGMIIYSLPYFLGGHWNVTVGQDNRTVAQLPSTISGFPLGSIAITGSSHWVICADRDTPCSKGVCVDMNKYAKLFLQRNCLKDSSFNNQWPKIVRKVQIVSQEECSLYPSPAPLSSKRIFKRDALTSVDVSVYEKKS